jgi:hypothetical protein
MSKLNILVFIVLYIIGNIIIFKGQFQNLINGTGTTKYQKSDEIVEGNHFKAVQECRASNKKGSSGFLEYRF